MKTQTLLWLSLIPLFIAFPASADGLKNFHPVSKSGLVLRGAQPLGVSTALLQAQVDQVLIFKNDTKGEVEKEIAELKQAGFLAKNIHHIPMAWKQMDLVQSCQQTIQALKVLAKAEAAGQTIYFHCTVGEDRTGMLAGLYRIMTEGLSTRQAFSEELCDRGYSDGNPNKPRNVTNEIEKGLTPLFIALGQAIETKQLNAGRLSATICQNLQLPTETPRCR